jgi:hypothetical protein
MDNPSLLTQHMLPIFLLYTQHLCEVFVSYLWCWCTYPYQQCQHWAMKTDSTAHLIWTCWEHIRDRVSVCCWTPVRITSRDNDPHQRRSDDLMLFLLNQHFGIFMMTNSNALKHVELYQRPSKAISLFPFHSISLFLIWYWTIIIDF